MMMELDLMEVSMANEYGDWMDARPAGQRMSGCIVRFDSATPEARLHVNGQHISVGVREVTLTPDGIEVRHDGGPIVSMHATPDETLASRGVTWGMSGGGGTTVIRAYDERARRYLDLRQQADYDRVRGAYSNLWVTWQHALGRD